jgi:hypothetical protein
MLAAIDSIFFCFCFLFENYFLLIIFSTAFYALSLIAQTPFGAMSLKEYGWETYRVRSHSIPPSVANTDNHHSIERPISKGTTSLSSSPRKSISLQVTPPPPLIKTDPSDNIARRELTESIPIDVGSPYRYNLQQDSNESEVKSKRSLTMPSTILLNVSDKNDVRHGK